MGRFGRLSPRHNDPSVAQTPSCARQLGGLRVLRGVAKGVAEEARTRGFASPAFAGFALVKRVGQDLMAQTKPVKRNRDEEPTKISLPGEGLVGPSCPICIGFALECDTVFAKRVAFQLPLAKVRHGPSPTVSGQRASGRGLAKWRRSFPRGITNIRGRRILRLIFGAALNVELRDGLYLLSRQAGRGIRNRSPDRVHSWPSRFTLTCGRHRSPVAFPAEGDAGCEERGS